MATATPEPDSNESAAQPQPQPQHQPSVPKSPNFYGYLFQPNKTPTATLDALLRAIALHIITEIGDKNVQALTPQKLAAFYKAVDGDYDSLFIQMPYPAISYIWQVTGCQHSMLPTENDYEPPSIPALTPRGFVRWESVEILLGPEEHVPFIQRAVKNWNLKHPETNEPFPTDLPAEAFPSKADPAIEKWHKECAEKLRKAAVPKDDNQPPASKAASAAPSWPPERDEPRVKAAYVHVRNPYPKPSPPPRGPQTDYFSSSSTRPVAFSHVPGHAAARYPPSRLNMNMPPKSPEQERFRATDSPEDRRRRSFSDYPSPSQEPMYHPDHLHPSRPPLQPRRHSQPRHYSSDSDSDGPASPRSKRRPHTHHSNEPPPPGFRRLAHTAHHSPPVQMPPTSARIHRAELRPEDTRRRSIPIVEGFREKITEKVASILPNGRSPDRHRSASGRRSDPPSRRSRERLPSSKLNRSWPEEIGSDASEASDSEDERRRRLKTRERREMEERERERERARDRDRGRDRRREREREYERDRDRDRDRVPDWERDEERDARRRRERHLVRPEVQRRTSSHADVDRMRERGEPPWDGRDRDSRDERKRWKEQRGGSPVISGVSGRQYPTGQAWN